MTNISPKIIFAGTPEFAAQHLAALLEAKVDIVAVLTQPDRPAGRGQQLTESPVKQIAKQHNLLVLQPENLKTIPAQLKSLNADVMIVVAYGLILPKEILTLPRLGCINVHASLLPKWRGASPIQHAILAGDKKTGVTLIQMVESLDAGPQILQKSCSISETDITAMLLNRLAELGKNALLEVVDKIKQNNIVLVEQDATQVTYAHKIKKQDAQINWQKKAVEVARQIRAFNPWPIAFTRMGGERVRIFEAIVLNETDQATPGKIFQCESAGIDVATGQGVIRLLKLQLPGGKVLPVQDLLNSKRDFFTQNMHFDG